MKRVADKIKVMSAKTMQQQADEPTEVTDLMLLCMALCYYGKFAYVKLWPLG